MLKKNKTACTESDLKITKLREEHTKLTKVMQTLERELRQWKERNSDLRFKLNYAMQVKL